MGFLRGQLHACDHISWLGTGACDGVKVVLLDPNPTLFTVKGKNKNTVTVKKQPKMYLIY
jgi:hypothetical protein